MAERRQGNTLIEKLWLPLAFVMAWLYEPLSSSGPDLCVWKLVTSNECWGCGITRALCALSHLEIKSALEYHQLSPVIALFLASHYLKSNKHLALLLISRLDPLRLLRMNHG